MTSPTQDPLHDLDADNPPRRFIVWITLAAVTALAIGWIYVLFIYRPEYLIDELPDRTFPTEAEQVCASAMARYELLPKAQAATSADERADVVAQSNVIFTDMVDGLRQQVDTVPLADRPGVSEWVEDWAVYITNRERYVEALRDDSEARFLETPKGRKTKGVTQAINSFAQVNRMESCVTPGDLA